MLCKDNVKKFISEPLNREWAYVSPKLDGVRCVAVVMPNGGILYFSRNGKVFNNFRVFDEAVRALYHIFINTCPEYCEDIFMLDGEVTAKQGDFSKVMTQVHRLKDIDATLFKYNVFDIPVMNDTPFVDRMTVLLEMFNKLGVKDNVELVRNTLIRCTDPQYLSNVMMEYCAKGYEGIVIKNGQSLYIEGKSKYWLKMKPWFSEDLLVSRAEAGTGKYSTCMGKLICIYKDHEVAVGTGFTDKERVEFWEAPPKMVEVKYQEMTNDGSLRFPVYLRVREDK